MAKDSRSMFRGRALWASLPPPRVIKSSSLSEAGSAASMGTAADDRAPWRTPAHQPCLRRILLLQPLLDQWPSSFLLPAPFSSSLPPNPPPPPHSLCSSTILAAGEVCAHNVQWVPEWRAPMLIPLHHLLLPTHAHTLSTVSTVCPIKHPILPY